MIFYFFSLNYYIYNFQIINKKKLFSLKESIILYKLEMNSNIDDLFR